MKDYFYIAITGFICIIFVYIWFNWQTEKSNLIAKVHEAEAKTSQLRENINDLLELRSAINESNDECLDRDIPSAIYNKLHK